MTKLLLTIFLFVPWAVNAQQSAIREKIDSVLRIQPARPFNGTILVAQQDSILYKEKCGYADLQSRETFSWDHTFIVGSIGKQFTAVLVLQEVEKGNIRLDESVSYYLPDLPCAWKDSVTIHHLLTHTHGIVSLDKPLMFAAGKDFSYSQIGYDLLAHVIEKVQNDSFYNISSMLFKRCGMNDTFHPMSSDNTKLVKCYKEDKDGTITEQTEIYEVPVAAGGFISTAEDLLIWNRNLFEGNLLERETLQQMITPYPYAVREHPIFGFTQYGYGITVDEAINLLQVGQTGYLPSFVSMDFYFPQTKTSVIVLENISYGDDLKDTFFYHTQILDIIKENIFKQSSLEYPCR